MTAAPVPRQPSPAPNRSGRSGGESTPVLALKELVARLNREQNKIQDLLGSLGFALRSLNNLNQFLELIPLMVSRVTDADGGALVMFRNGQVKLERLHCQDGQWGKELRRSLESVARKTTSALSVVAASELPVKSVQAYAALDYQVGRVLGDDVQIFGTPILVRNTERGRLYVFSRADTPSHWTEQRQKLVRLVADQTAVAIENDELTTELRRKERLDRELEIGAEIQLQLLPRQYPVIDGLELSALCRTANRVGGDYYDFIPSRQTNASGDPSERWSITIGDVMGKGVPAGLIMTMTRGMLRAEVLNGHSPAKVLRHLNQVMFDDLENSNRFVTLFYSEYDPTTQVLSYSNAAHNPPLVWQAATNTIQRLDTVGMLIGLDVNTQFQEAEVQLQPGDVVIYYTDGFTEATNSQGQQFDEVNLLEELQRACKSYRDAQQILQHLFDRVQQFSGAGNPKDDMTLVVLRVQVPGEVKEEKAKRRIELPPI
ncbi:SpoIIE family protein phosphatase [filamentous cyanobacterium LEGE 11480]|uniref:SpoIIE family protein phosphatase n=1 Tax=Romeriopsis navalis LEGE 11480 TaxID=2777977 RepID=A0A928VUI3_9CYAN|nr:GAF domain-containing SpoIIE family protein phosphatase [Romeriopsis navalis]MBE9032319.1 SpoIIE family protein phosphatase [Romeriopsis navalis LEGE 11480]